MYTKGPLALHCIGTSVLLSLWVASLLYIYIYINGLTRKEIFEILKSDLKAPAAETYNKIEKVMSAKVNATFTLTDKYKGTIRTLASKIRNKYNDSSHLETRFYQNNDEWLNVFILITVT